LSKFLTPEALKQLPSPTLEKLQLKAKDSVVKIETNIKLETDYIKRYQKLMKSLIKAAHIPTISDQSTDTP